MNKNSLASLLISVALIGGMMYFLSDAKITEKNTPNAPSQNVYTQDGIQYVNVTAKGGYTPRVTEIESGVPTKLIVTTNNTYDCSSALVIRNVGFQKMLQPSGEEVIDLGTPKSGDIISGVCSMGMYSFALRAK
ncbi:hypothetical protein IT409_02615 [Candidatus Falkowbacteria bacterium]|nr:hypothetical protein [Candidatus Falkowbacteria bacterium]